MSQEIFKEALGKGGQPAEYHFGLYRVGIGDLTLRFRGTVIAVAPKVVKTLVILLDHAGQVVSKEKLLQTVWGGSEVEEANLSQNIYTLRRIFEANSGDDFIETLPRRGYCFTGSVSKAAVGLTTAARPKVDAWLSLGIAAMLICVAALLRSWAVSKPADISQSSVPLNATAEQQYALGWYYWHFSTASALRQSVQHFDLAGDASPRSPLGYAGAAAAHAKLADIYEGSPSGVAEAVKAAKLSQQAIALNPNSGVALAVKGLIEFDLDGNNRAAAADLRRAVTIEPSLAVAHVWYGAVLLWEGEPATARAELERAAGLDSELPSLNYLLALDYYMSRDYKTAIAFGTLATADPWPGEFSRFLLAAAHEKAGQYSLAIQDVGNLSTDPSEALAVSGTLAHVYASMGNYSRARRELLRVQRLSERYHYRPLLTAIAYVANGRPDDAFAWLSRLPQSDRALFALDPRFDPIRHDPRFLRWLHG